MVRSPTFSELRSLIKAEPVLSNFQKIKELEPARKMAYSLWTSNPSITPSKLESLLLMEGYEVIRSTCITWLSRFRNPEGTRDSRRQYYNDNPEKKLDKNSKLRQYYLDNPDKRESHRAKMRSQFTGITLNGKYTLVETPNKRPYPEDKKCELCHKGPRLLGYHHWDDKNISKGLWLCPVCHPFAEKVDHSWVEKYKAIREAVNVEFVQKEGQQCLTGTPKKNLYLS